MTNTSRKKAVDAYRARQTERGLVRFEVTAPADDRELVRALVRKLAQPGAEAQGARDGLRALLGDEPPSQGGIVAALRRSPLVGANLDLSRSREEGRELDL